MLEFFILILIFPRGQLPLLEYHNSLNKYPHIFVKIVCHIIQIIINTKFMNYTIQSIFENAMKDCFTNLQVNCVNSKMIIRILLSFLHKYMCISIIINLLIITKPKIQMAHFIFSSLDYIYCFQ